MRLRAEGVERLKWEVRKAVRGWGEEEIAFLKEETALRASVGVGKEPRLTRTPNISA